MGAATVLFMRIKHVFSHFMETISIVAGTIKYLMHWCMFSYETEGVFDW